MSLCDVQISKTNPLRSFFHLIVVNFQRFPPKNSHRLSILSVKKNGSKNDCFMNKLCRSVSTTLQLQIRHGHCETMRCHPFAYHKYILLDKSKWILGFKADFENYTGNTFYVQTVLQIHRWFTFSTVSKFFDWKRVVHSSRNSIDGAAWASWKFRISLHDCHSGDQITPPVVAVMLSEQS